jgi:ketosteroid isomerase-like protein
VRPNVHGRGPDPGTHRPVRRSIPSEGHRSDDVAVRPRHCVLRSDPAAGLPGCLRLPQALGDAFGSFVGAIAYEVHDLRVVVGGDIAFTHSLNRKSGTLANEQTSEQWLRWTACWRKADDRWLITHEHVSVPVDPATGDALLHLTPSDQS